MPIDERYSLCNGCGVCTLSCPIWQQGHDALSTFMGRARALLGGAEVSELKDSVSACLLCGSCEPVCSMGIPTIDITLALRSMLNGEKQSWRYQGDGIPTSDTLHSTLLPGTAMRKHDRLLKQASALLDVLVSEDDGTDILEAFQNGRHPDTEKLEAFFKTLSGTGKLIVADGLMKRFMRHVVPGLEVTGLGEALLRLPSVRAGLRSTDLYIIEARAYNSDHKRCAPLYTKVSRQTGCAMNLDLQRIAIPTGTYRRANAECSSAPGIRGQVSWILDCRSFERIVVEAVEDMELFREQAGVPVIHVAELAGEIS